MNYNRKITYFVNSPVSDGSGGYTDSWSAGTVIWADVEVLNNARVMIQGQEEYTTLYVIQVRAQAIKYVPPVNNYKIQINAYGVNRTLKILSASQPDLYSFNQIFNCIESNE